MLCMQLEDSLDSAQTFLQPTKLQQLTELHLGYTDLTSVPAAASTWGVLPQLYSLCLGFDLTDENDALNSKETEQFFSHVGSCNKPDKADY